MTTRVEWMNATEVEVGVFGPGEDWLRAEDQDPDAHVLTLTANEVAAIEGSPAALLALVDRIRRAVTAALTADLDTDTDAGDTER